MNLIFLLCVFVQTAAYQHQYEVLVDKFVVEYFDNKLMDVTAEVIQTDRLKGINVCFTSKVEVPESVTVTAAGYKGIGNDYRIPVMQIRKSVKEVLEMEMFDLQNLWIHISRPPMVWPLKKNVAYRINNWIPNSTNFPPNLPSGKWKVRITESFANKTKLAVLNFFGRIEYLKISRKSNS